MSDGNSSITRPRISIETVIVLVLTALGWAYGYGTLSSKVDDLNTNKTELLREIGDLKKELKELSEGQIRVESKLETLETRSARREARDRRLDLIPGAR